MISVTLAMKTTNPLNGSHGHWSIKAKQRKHHRFHTLWSLRVPILEDRARGAIGYPLDVTVTRLAPSNGLDPHDGLGAALKGVIDGIADALGLKNDRDPRVRFWLAQERHKAYGVHIEIKRAA